MKKTIILLGAALCLLSGCSNKVRYRTAGGWLMSEDRKPVALYQTYLEGTCSSGFLGWGKGCSDTNSKLIRCTLNADNTLTCVEDAAANAFLNKDIPER